jgi:DNA polymerase-4
MIRVDMEILIPSARKVLHVDADAFFASVEQRDNPDLRGRPVAVGGSKARGVVAAASYEARKFGVHSAMPSVTASRKCPELVFVKPRFEVYRTVSQQMRAIFAEYTPLIEPLSLDEAYLDVTVNHMGMEIATEIAEDIRRKVRAETELTVSVGVSYAKFMAKMASDMRKPDGLFVITPKNGPKFMETLPVKKFHGVGPSTAERMHSLGIFTGADLRAQSEEFLRRHFGKSGPYFYLLSRGIDERPVNPDRIRKSVGAETTFDVDLEDLLDAEMAIRKICDEVWRRCARHEARGRTTTLKVKYADFEQITRSKSLSRPFTDVEEMTTAALLLLRNLHPFVKGVRLLGVTASNFEGEDDGHAEDANSPQLELTF